MAARTPTRSLLVIIVVAEYIAQSYSAPAHSARRCRLNDTRRDLAFGQIPEDIQKISGIYRTDWWRSLVWRGPFSTLARPRPSAAPSAPSVLHPKKCGGGAAAAITFS